MKKHITIIMLLVLSSSHCFSQREVKAKYLEETELVSIVAHLAEIPGYTWEDEALPDYMVELDSVFAPYKEHPAVIYARKELMNEGFNWNFPIDVALQLKIIEGKIRFNDSLVSDYNDYYDRITRKKEKRFVKLLQHFYDETPFREFYENHKPLYQECEKAMQKVVDMIDFGWYDSFFGPNENSTFNICMGILIGPANYAVNKMRKDGQEVIYAMMGCCDRDEKGQIYYGVEYTLPIILHECNHSYCNPLNEKVWESIKDKAQEIFTPNAKFYDSIAYGAPIYVMNETFVEACVIRYLMKHPVDLNGYTLEDWIKMDEVKKKFVLIRDIIKVLEEREAHPDRYPTMEDFMPRYIQAVNEFKMPEVSTP